MNMLSYYVNVGATFLGEGEFNVIILVGFLIGCSGETGKFPFHFDHGMSMARTCHS